MAVASQHAVKTIVCSQLPWCKKQYCLPARVRGQGSGRGGLVRVGCSTSEECGAQKAKTDDAGLVTREFQEGNARTVFYPGLEANHFTQNIMRVAEQLSSRPLPRDSEFGAIKGRRRE